MHEEKVLFVDDDVWCHLENCEFLRERGFHVVEAYSASEAYAQISSPPELTALITDIELGSAINGFEIARRARAAYPDVPVVYMSGTAVSRHRSEGVLRSEFVSKPFHPHEIVEALGRATNIEAA